MRLLNEATKDSRGSHGCIYMEAFRPSFIQGRHPSLSAIYLPQTLGQNIDHRGIRAQEIRPWIICDRHLAENIIRKKNTLKQFIKIFLTLKFMENIIF